MHCFLHRMWHRIWHRIWQFTIFFTACGAERTHTWRLTRWIISASTILIFSGSFHSSIAQDTIPGCLDLPDEGSKSELLQEAKSLFASLAKSMEQLNQFVDSTQEREDFKSIQQGVQVLHAAAMGEIATLPSSFSLCIFPMLQSNCEQIPLDRNGSKIGAALARTPPLLLKAERILRQDARNQELPQTQSSKRSSEEKERERRRARIALENHFTELDSLLNWVPPMVFVCS